MNRCTLSWDMISGKIREISYLTLNIVQIFLIEFIPISVLKLFYCVCNSNVHFLACLVVDDVPSSLHELIGMKMSKLQHLKGKNWLQILHNVGRKAAKFLAEIGILIFHLIHQVILMLSVWILAWQANGVIPVRKGRVLLNCLLQKFERKGIFTSKFSCITTTKIVCDRSQPSAAQKYEHKLWCKILIVLLIVKVLDNWDKFLSFQNFIFWKM